MRKFLSIVVVSVIVLSSVTLSCCQSSDAGSQNNVALDISGVVDHQNGVYYFPYTNADFGKHLSAFIAQHPDLQLLAIAGDGASGYGRNFGFFVVFKQSQ